MSPAIHVAETGITLEPDPGRVIARFFVPGKEDVGAGDSRAAPVIRRVLDLDDDEVDTALADVLHRFSDRHRDLTGIVDRHADLVLLRLDPSEELRPAHRRLLGAAFTHEYAVEGAALCNPSIVAHPDQDEPGAVRFVMSVRGIGEGHRSSIGFRTGHVTDAGRVHVDPPGRVVVAGTVAPGTHQRVVVHSKLAELDDDRDNAAHVLDALDTSFGDDDLSARLASLLATDATRTGTRETTTHLLAVAASSYRVRFDESSELAERVLWPESPAERHGMEDARFVRFTADDGRVTYLATYTAFDGSNVAQHLLETSDFVSFSAAPLGGPAAVGKGLALFPRTIGGRFVALSRSDRESNSLATSDDRWWWNDAGTIQVPTRSWEVLQLGNCGSPIETDEGWLVLTHGVGPMRTYSIGALLLDLHDPLRVIATMDDPIIGPERIRQDGYVPNVVYSCGALAHGDMLVLPYAIGDRSISVATASIGSIIGAMRRT